LRSAGIDPIQHITDVDEPAVLAAALATDPNLPPASQVLALARAKAEAADQTLATGPVELVLGCDSMVELDGVVLGKPPNAAEAIRRIRQQSGREVILHTGHWLLGPAKESSGRRGEGATSSTVVRFAELTDQEIEAYVATGEPLGVAGAFTIDGLGGPFIEGVVGDHHGVAGLSLPTLRHLLARFGLTVPQLWRA
jgi:septum formation protein